MNLEFEFCGDTGLNFEFGTCNNSKPDTKEKTLSGISLPICPGTVTTACGVIEEDEE